MKPNEIKYHAVNIIKSVAEQHSIEDFNSITQSDLSFDEEYKLISWQPFKNVLRSQRDKVSVPANKDLFNIYLEKLFSEDHNGKEYYHFLPRPEFAAQIIENSEFQLASLKQYIKSDKDELFAFVNECGYGIRNREDFFNRVKDNMFILCLTNSELKKRFWKEYANEHKGACMKIKINNFNISKEYDKFIRLSRVLYEIPFLTGLNKQLTEELDVKINPTGSYWAMKYYKMKCFQWEEEIRLGFDNDLKTRHDYLNQFFYQDEKMPRKISHIFQVYKQPKRSFLKVPLYLENEYDFEIKELIFGKEIVPKSNIHKTIVELCQAKGIQCNRNSSDLDLI